MLWIRSSARSIRPQAFTLDINSPKIFPQACTITKKRSKSSPNQIHQTFKQVSLPPRPISTRRNYSHRTIEINYKDEQFYYKHLHTQRIWKIGNQTDQATLRKKRPGKGQIGVLQRFRDYMERKIKKRVPLVVQDILDHNTIQF